jgi:hypothetical protein
VTALMDRQGPSCWQLHRPSVSVPRPGSWTSTWPTSPDGGGTHSAAPMGPSAATVPACRPSRARGTVTGRHLAPHRPETQPVEGTRDRRLPARHDHG